MEIRQFETRSLISNLASPTLMRNMHLTATITGEINSRLQSRLPGEFGLGAPLVGTVAGLAPRSSQLAARMTYCSRSMPLSGGADGIRTHYLFNAIEALSQLSYSPAFSNP